MLQIKMEGLGNLREALTEFSDRRFAAAIATAMTRTAVKVRDEEQRRLPQVFDRPTPYTVRQLRYVPATAARPVSAVGFDIARVSNVATGTVEFEQRGVGETPASNYVEHNIQGGQRKLKGLEWALRALGVLPMGWLVVPSKSEGRDAYGNVPKGRVTQIITQLRRNALDIDKSTLSRKVINAERRAGGTFFAIPPGRRMQPGIYMRDFYSEVIVPVYVFVRGTKHPKRFPFYDDAQRIADATLAEEVPKAIEESLARLKARG